VVVPNGLDVARFAPKPLRSPRRRLVMVANLRPGKGHATLIDAAALVLQRLPDARFDIIGDGTERERLVRYAADRGLASAFVFHGHCDDVPAKLAEADVFVLPSESEAFPNAVLEAMAAGLPVVASAVGGILEVVQHDRTGLLVPPRDPVALADALHRVLSDDVLAARVASAGRAVVDTRYSFERMIASFEAIYSEQLLRRGVAPARSAWASR
jgi:glycosyltransferase involved in cell wall biosynthesis